MNELMIEPEDALALSLEGGPSASRFLALLKRYGSLRDLLKQPDGVLLAEKGIGPEILKRLRRTRLVDLERERTKMNSAGITPLIFGQPGYPEALSAGMFDPPLVLYTRGDPAILLEAGVAVVGTRRPSVEGTRMTRVLGKDLGSFPFVVISGLATGIDGIAHASCLEAGGRTVAVLAHGHQTIQPQANKKLAHSLLDGGGALVTEYPLGVEARKHTFVPRNRIIAGLAVATVVVEGGLKSGARHTADFALEYGKVLLAVPGRPYDPMSALPNQLIHEKKAELCRGLHDVLASLPHYQIGSVQQAIEARAELLGRKAEKALRLLGDDAAVILEKVSIDPLHVDDICRLTGMGAPRVLSLLLQMEIEGVVEQLPGMRYTANYMP